MTKTNDVIGLGNTLMDFLIEIEDHKLLELDLKKGEMHLVEEEKAKTILKKIEQEQLKIETVPGGSAANTLKGIAFLGGKAILCGKVGADKHGLNYIEEMQNLGVTTRIGQHSAILTGHALTFITPDTQRTFSVHLGAALHLTKEDVLEEDIQNSKILHLEGYQLEGATKETILEAMELARKHGTLISLDLADPGVIRRNLQFLQLLVQDYVNILFVNEAEAKEFTGLEEEEALLELGQYVDTAVVKIGKRGSLILHEKKVHHIAPVPAKAIDTTGAGDTFAAGFLYGLCQDWSLEKAGRLGSALAAKIVEQKGVCFKEIDVEEVKRSIV